MSTHRVVNAYKSPILPKVDESLHLVAHPASVQTLCSLDVSNMTMIPIECWGLDDGVEIWCPKCAARIGKAQPESDFSYDKPEPIGLEPSTGRSGRRRLAIDMERAKALLAEGKLIRDIATMMGTSTSLLQRRGLRRGKVGRAPVTPAQEREIIQAVFVEGCTQNEAAARCGVSQHTIWRFVQKHKREARMQEANA